MCPLGLSQKPALGPQKPLHFELWATDLPAVGTVLGVSAEVPQLRHFLRVSEAPRGIPTLADHPQAVKLPQCEAPPGANSQKATLQAKTSQGRAQARVKVSPAVRQQRECLQPGFF